MPETRELFFDSLENLLGEQTGSHYLVSELFAEASKRAQAKATEDGFISEKKWNVAGRCTQRLMIWAGVLKSDKGSIEDKIGCNSNRVTELAPNFRRVCEGYLATYIIREMAGISYDDDPCYLGLTLYRRGQQKAVPAEELKAKANELLTYLSDERLIEMNGDRNIVVSTHRRGLSVVDAATG
jgi:hypothetical protein